METTKFHKRDTLEKVMFGWVHALRTVLPACSVEQAIKSFMQKYDLEQTENAQSLRTTYQRMLKEYFGEQKTKSIPPKSESDASKNQ